MSEEHVVDHILLHDRRVVQQGGDFPAGTALLDPFEEEDEAIDRPGGRNGQRVLGGKGVGKQRILCISYPGHLLCRS